MEVILFLKCVAHTKLDIYVFITVAMAPRGTTVYDNILQ